MTSLPRADGVGGGTGHDLVSSPALSRTELVLAVLCVIAGVGAIVVNVVGLAGWLA